MVWDLNKKQAVPLHREQVGWHYQTSGIDAALTGTYRVKLLNGREVDAMPVWQLYLVHFQDYDLDTCPSDLPDAQGSLGAMGPGFRLDQARRDS